tara:strand:- start:288 stop:995 length:708 start_codon:yes stop_codon:yes gene_type:complete
MLPTQKADNEQRYPVLYKCPLLAALSSNRGDMINVKFIKGLFIDVGDFDLDAPLSRRVQIDGRRTRWNNLIFGYTKRKKAERSRNGEFLGLVTKRKKAPCAGHSLFAPRQLTLKGVVKSDLETVNSFKRQEDNFHHLTLADDEFVYCSKIKSIAMALDLLETLQRVHPDKYAVQLTKPNVTKLFEELRLDAVGKQASKVPCEQGTRCFIFKAKLMNKQAINLPGSESLVIFNSAG